MAGRVLGRLLVNGIDWGAAFWVSALIGIVAFALAQRFLP